MKDKRKEERRIVTGNEEEKKDCEKEKNEGK